MTPDDHFARVRKLVDRKFTDGNNSIELEVEMFRDEKTVCICVANRYGDLTCVNFKADTKALREFVAAINEIVLPTSAK